MMVMDQAVVVGLTNSYVEFLRGSGTGWNIFFVCGLWFIAVDWCSDDGGVRVIV